MFDLTTIAALHGRGVGVVPVKNVLAYGGQVISDMFPVQVRFFPGLPARIEADVAQDQCLV